MSDDKPSSDPMELDGADDAIEIEFVDQDDDGDGAYPPSVAGPVGDGDSSAGPASALAEENERLRNELETLREVYLRKLAEFDNYRKRTDRERDEMQRTAGEGVVRELIPVFDNFERALIHRAEGDTESFRQGIEMIAKQFWDVLERQGLEVVDPTGQPFDPELHEAVQRIEDGEHPAGTVVWVLAKGYLFGGRLLRPAMVGVAVDPPEAREEGGGS